MFYTLASLGSIALAWQQGLIPNAFMVFIILYLLFGLGPILLFSLAIERTQQKNMSFRTHHKNRRYNERW